MTQLFSESSMRWNSPTFVVGQTRVWVDVRPTLPGPVRRVASVKKVSVIHSANLVIRTCQHNRKHKHSCKYCRSICLPFDCFGTFAWFTFVGVSFFVWAQRPSCHLVGYAHPILFAASNCCGDFVTEVGGESKPPSSSLMQREANVKTYEFCGRNGCLKIITPKWISRSAIGMRLQTGKQRPKRIILFTFFHDRSIHDFPACNNIQECTR
jgi:hypothetical protein